MGECSSNRLLIMETPMINAGGRVGRVALRAGRSRTGTVDPVVTWPFRR
jgi:hypothetical protein